jgi:hypothetical protein
LNLRLTNIIGVVTSLIIFSSCSIHGTYKNRFNSDNLANWIKINPNNTFEFIALGHMMDYGYTKGSWEKRNDSIFLTKFEPKLPSTNQLIELNDVKKNIKLSRLNNRN